MDLLALPSGLLQPDCAVMIALVLFLMFFGQVSFAEDFFGLGPVEFFSGTAKLRQSMEKAQADIDWREPVMGRDGQVHYALPLPVVLQLLNDPSDHNARVYVDWQQRRMRRVMQAQQAIERAQNSGLEDQE